MALLEHILYIKTSTLPGVGQGLFTQEIIPKGVRIVEYKGRRITWAEAKKLPDSHNGYLFYISSKKCIDAWGYKKAFARYANDTRGIVRVKGITTNSKYVIESNRCYVEALRDIPAHAEIFVHYGLEYWKTTRENNKIEQRAQRNGKPTVRKKHRKGRQPREVIYRPSCP